MLPNTIDSRCIKRKVKRRKNYPAFYFIYNLPTASAAATSAIF